MSENPVRLTPAPEGYADWLVELKSRIHSAQQRATLAVNQELVLLYWQIGRDILARQAEAGWGAKVIDRLAHDLRTAFPDMKGFSPRNLKYMRAFAEAWTDTEFVQEVLAQLGVLTMTEHKAIPHVSVNYARNGSSKKINELGMRAMQERAF